jgi:hypothetical protein
MLGFPLQEFRVGTPARASHFQYHGLAVSWFGGITVWQQHGEVFDILDGGL